MADQPIMIWWSGDDAGERHADEVLQLRGGPASPRAAAENWWLDWCQAAVCLRATDGHPVCVRWSDGTLYRFEIEIEANPVAHAREVSRG